MRVIQVDADNSFAIRTIGCDHGLRILLGGECAPVDIGPGARAWIAVHRDRRDAPMNPYGSRLMRETFGTSDAPLVWGPILITTDGIDTERQWVENYQNYLVTWEAYR